MRDIWDKDKKALNVQKEGRILARRERRLTGFEKESLAKHQKCFMEHLRRKKLVMDFFPEYEKYLGEGGFTKI